jgi:hypothetical protein
VDADNLAPGDQQFTYIGGAAFSGVRGELRYENGIVRGDVNGDGSDDLQIELFNNPAITVNDILL